MNDLNICYQYIENVWSTANVFQEFADRKFTIIINETFKIELPLIVASSLFSSIAKLIKSDSTANEFHVTINSPLNDQKILLESLNKIKSVLCGNSKVSFNLNNEKDFNDIWVFAAFGAATGNKDFIKPMITLLSMQDSNNEDNVVRKLQMKQILVLSIDEMSNEISFISSHFENMSNREDFINFAQETTNARIVESIIISDKLRMNDEDTLLTFLMTINKERTLNDIEVELFDYVMFEYCSANTCKEFISFICSKFEERKVKTIISCIGRRFTQSNIPMNPPFIKGRHKPRVLIDNKDPLNGILRREHEKGNVLLEPSSKGSSDAYCLLKADDNHIFFTENSPNSFIKASLKDERTFILKSYMIKGNKLGDNKGQLKNWKLEGERASDGKWILLDSHDEDPIKKLQVRTFNVSCKVDLKSVKLTQTEKNTSNNDQLIINGFDVFGFLSEELDKV